ncbi:MAG TPA: alginate export family protein [Arenimonas sp.]|uniref:alginate export family protein n=1 Tax=Arenimonas sp. TaxID=1872635 RepID=UPI002D7F725D|nr:alginate export family protein [Arenimonas sp.]HEU0153065.1 alginate export family protein [Arenimonas sp.]
MTHRHAILLFLGLLPLPAARPAAAADGWTAHLRYRHESVDDEAFARDAAADTVRLRLGWSHALAPGFSTGFELEGVAALGDRFNSGANGETAYPWVPDARALELNQAWLRWRGERGGATLGRQRITLDDQRFVGNVGWRQNEQTFDAFSADATLRDGLVLRYAWLDRAHRVFGDEARDPLARERRLDTHLLNLAWQRGGGRLTGYGYWHDDKDVATASTRTLGLRWTGARTWGGADFGWTLEAARQRDHAGNPNATDVGYVLVEPSLAARGLTWTLGWEQLGGDGARAFQTPLATLHAFNGWADKFLVTPAAGLDDRHAAVSGKFGRGRLDDRLAWTVAYHDFRADRGGLAYGREWDASMAFPLPAGFTGLLKFADYRSDGFARDTRKLWLQVERAWP